MSSRIGSLLLGTAMGMLLASIAAATPPTPPGRVSLDPAVIAGRIGEDRSFAIPVVTRLETQVTSAQLIVSVRPVRDPVASVAGKDVQRSVTALRQGSPGEHRAVFKLGEAGDYQIDVRLTGKMRDGSGFSDRAIYYLVLARDGSYRTLTPKQWTVARRKAREARFDEALRKDPRRPQIRLLMESSIAVPKDIESKARPHAVPAEQQLTARPVGPSETLKRFSTDKSASSWAPKDPLTVRGRLLYLDFDGVWRPLVNVSVNIWDSDTGFDEHLGTVGTDWSGNWSFSVNNDDGWFADGRDIYYSFKLENTRIRVEDCDGIDSVYEWESAVHDDLNDGAVVDYGTETGSTDTGSMQLWNHLNLSWNHASGTGGQDPGFVDSCFPEDATHWDRFWEELDIEAQYVDGPDVVFHEYGHAVMYYAYDEDNPSPGGSHSFDACALDSSHAWSEGWATAFMLAGRADGTFNWHEGDGGRAVELFSAACRDGTRNEGRVAAALNDMVDRPNDCNGASEDRGRANVCDGNAAQRVPFATMLRDTLWGGWHDDVKDYWSNLSGELTSAQRAAAREIMSYNWMPVTITDSCVASKIVTAAEVDADEILSGLRKLRDNGLKTFGGGRRLIRLYYRHSPELALLLLRDRTQLARALRVVRHFSALGHNLSIEASARRLRTDVTPIIPAPIAADIEALLTYVQGNGSRELSASIDDLRSLHRDLSGLTLQEVIDRVSARKNRRPDGGVRIIDQSDLSEASRKALPEVQAARARIEAERAGQPQRN